jgi:hypothetical protein
VPVDITVYGAFACVCCFDAGLFDMGLADSICFVFITLKTEDVNGGRKPGSSSAGDDAFANEIRAGRGGVGSFEKSILGLMWWDNMSKPHLQSGRNAEWQSEIVGEALYALIHEDAWTVTLVGEVSGRFISHYTLISMGST